MKHIFIVNPAAGPADADSTVRSYLQTRKDIDWEIYRTKGTADATAFVRRWGEEHPGEEVRFYACGGDGTLNEVASGAVGNPDASVTVYPCGSGNDFVKYYGGREAFLDIGALIDAPDSPIDLMRVGDRYAINVTNFGFDTCVAKTMIRVKRKKIIGGKRAYITGVVAGLLSAMNNKCTVRADGEALNNGRMLLCTVANGSYVGGSFKCAPRSVNDDGLLEVCLFKPLNHIQFIGLLGDYTAGRHLDVPKFQKYLQYRRAKRVDVEAPEGFAFSLDGEIVSQNRFSIEIAEKALRFAVPGATASRAEEGAEPAVV